MQATVSSYDAATQSGRVLLDDGVELPFASAALAGTGLRLLRPGQRVRVEVDRDDSPGSSAAAPQVRRLQILTLA